MIIRRHICSSMKSMSYVTSPIFYANAEPHIGHAYTAILCDAAHRWNKLKKPSEAHIFSIGTDEHGNKIFRASKNAEMDPKVFCDQVSSKFENLFRKLNVSSTHFIRTTDPHHSEAVQVFWTKLKDGGHIYKSKYSGYYSIVDECFVQETEIEDRMVNGNTVKVLKSNSAAVEWVEEENYMFRLTNFKDNVLKWIENNDIVYPKKYSSMAIQSLSMESDLSVSRSTSRSNWGIPVPNDSSQTIYVWLDALVNYLTVSGYPKSQTVWPPTCQVIGKDILKFHLFYWPAFLMAAGIELPKKFFVHGHWLVNNIKMSKSIGNVVDPNYIIDKFSSEGLRYFLLKNGNPNDDCNFSETSLLDTINSDIVNNIGNLLNRSTVAKLNPDGLYPKLNSDELHPDIRQSCESLFSMIEELEEKSVFYYDNMMYYKAIELLMSTMKEANRVFQVNEPWKEKNEEKLESILFVSYESLRIISIFLQPIVPDFAEFCMNRLGIDRPNRKLDNLKFGKYEGGQLGRNNGVFMERLQK